MNFNAEQLKAIEARNHTILVSAAAGSGKTAVLIERITRLIREGARLSRMLIITFTRAAAGEMKQRLLETLMKEYSTDPELFGQALDDLETAQVSTIHSFCQHVLKEHFQLAGIDPMYRIATTQQRETLFEQAWHSAMNKLLEAGNADVRALTEVKSNADLLELCSHVYKFMLALPDPFSWLAQSVQALTHRPFEDTPWYDQLCREAMLRAEGLDDYLAILRRAADEPDAVPDKLKTYPSDTAIVKAIQAAAEKGIDALREACRTTALVKAPVVRGASEAEKKWSEAYQKKRKAMQDAITEIGAWLTVDPERAELELGNLLPYARGLEAILQETHALFRESKREEDIIDFSDMEQMTNELLEIPDCRASVQAEYDHIFVDECQDVSAIQDAIVRHVHSEHSCLFMVGDPKQSIYRFRQADPTLFMGYIASFSDAEDAPERRIFLQNNYRSRIAVLESANEVFSRAMRRSVTEMDYSLQDHLRAGTPSENDPPIEIRISEAPEKGGAEPVYAEADIVIRRIRELLQTDKDPAKPGEKYRLRDMVILLRKAKGVESELAEYLRKAGIPTFSEGKDNYYDLPEIRRVKAVLELIDNRLHDVQLIAALQLHPFSFTDEDLAQLRLTQNSSRVSLTECFDAEAKKDTELGRRCREAAERLTVWRFKAEFMHLPDFLWYILRETGFYAACSAMPGGDQRQSNLRLLCVQAEEYEQNSSGGLHGFINEMTLRSQTGDSTSAHTLGANEDLVRIMTMHKSKGLEFPVVFIMRATADLLQQDRSSVHMHKDLGLSMGYMDAALHAHQNHTLLNTAFKLRREMEERSECCRLLYVAMTRAKDRMIITGCTRRDAAAKWTMAPGDHRVSSVSSMLDWIMQAVNDEMPGIQPGSEPIESLPWLIAGEAETDAAGEAAPEEREDRLGKIRQGIRALMAEAPDPGVLRWWDHDVRDLRPRKTSVTGLVHRAQEPNAPFREEDLEETAATKQRSAPHRLEDEVPDRPAFMMEKKPLTAAEIGTAVHRFMMLTPLERLRGLRGAELTAFLQAQLDDLHARDVFSDDEYEKVSVSAVAAFWESDIAQRMLHADEVRREWGFCYRIDNPLIDGYRAREFTVLQGVIDVAFREGGHWIILDYKTDRVTDLSVFADHHRGQLGWYAKALTELSGTPVVETWLYALSVGEAVKVEVTMPEGIPQA